MAVHVAGRDGLPDREPTLTSGPRLCRQTSRSNVRTFRAPQNLPRPSARTIPLRLTLRAKSRSSPPGEVDLDFIVSAAGQLTYQLAG
jgi:hypothetical protein